MDVFLLNDLWLWKDLPNNIKKKKLVYAMDLEALKKPYDKEAWRYIKNKSDIKEFVLKHFLRKVQIKVSEVV